MGHHEVPLQITQDEKFFSRLLSKESSADNPSFRVYYGVAAAGAVPFRWESQPGTPKHAMAAATLPPLTPPPSYHSISSQNKTAKTATSHKENKLIRSIFPRLITHRKPRSPLRPMSSSSSSSRSQRRGHCSSPRSSFSSNCSRGDDEESEEGFSPTSTLCFWERPHAGGGKRGCYSMAVMKTALLSIVGHGSAA